MSKRYCALFFFIFFCSTNASAQICSGTINTIWKDDFGSGTNQFEPNPDTNITNGYIFQEGGVHEGNYGIVNRLDYFSSWHTITTDHTVNDSNGYFLVIDGNASSPVFYRVNVSNICPFTNYSFSTAVMNIDLPSFQSDQTFTFIISDLSGNQIATWTSPPIGVTDSAAWQELGFSFNSGNNTAVKLEIKFNQTGYDDFAFDDIRFSVCGPALDITTNGNNKCAASLQLTAVLGAGYVSPVYQWQKKNASGIFTDIAGANASQYTENNITGTNTYAVKVGDGGLSCPIIDTELVAVTSGILKTSISQSICKGNSFEGYTQTGIYTDTFSRAGQCDSIRILNLQVNDIPAISLTNDTAICISNTLQLNASGGLQYSWSPAAGLSNATVANPVANPVVSTKYMVEVTAANGCAGKDSVSITVKQPVPFTINPDTAICKGHPVYLSAFGGNTFAWSPANDLDNPFSATPVATTSSSTTFTVTINDAACQRNATLSTRVTILELPTIMASSSNSINCAAPSTNLMASGAITYTWVPATNLSDPASAAPVASPVTTTTYTVTGFDANNCSNTATVQVPVNLSGKSLFFMPGSFTPNGDGFNDCYRLKYFGPVISFQLEIFNRFGQKVFASNNTQDCWDGKYKGQKQNTENFIYHLKAQTACGAVNKKGNVLLIR
jgi:gliding motility-associated-like protein